MLIPDLQGTFLQHHDFIYTAADSKYFDDHGKALINSVLKNTNYGIHIHLYNPLKEQLEWCNQDRVSVSYETIDLSIFSIIADEWLHKEEFENQRQKQMFDKGKIIGKPFLEDLITKTYYACCRFTRLNQLYTSDTIKCLSIDVDGLVRKNFSMILDSNNDFYLYKKKSNEHLAGAILFNKNSLRFLHDYSRNIKKKIENNDIYWFMDQVVLDKIAPKYNPGTLPISYIDWEMADDSSIWSAKGKRKFIQLFTDEQKKYIV